MAIVTPSQRNLNKRQNPMFIIEIIIPCRIICKQVHCQWLGRRTFTLTYYSLHTYIHIYIYIYKELPVHIKPSTATWNGIYLVI